MRIAFFHNWSWLGGAVGRALIEQRKDELWMIGAAAPMAERDPELRELARRAQAVLAAPREIGSPSFLHRLSLFAPDLILVATFAKKLPHALLSIAKVASINIHASLLPKYRGALPEFWVLRNGDRETGVTAHFMTEEFDAGRIVAQASLPIHPCDDLLTLSERIAKTGAPMVLEVLDAYRRGERPEGLEQDPAEVSYAPMPDDRHLKIIWSESCASIERLVRAASPMLEPFTFFRGEKLIVRRLAPVMGTAPALSPGELAVDEQSGALLAGCATGAVALEEIELPGGFRVRGVRFARLFGPRKGEALGWFSDGR